MCANARPPCLDQSRRLAPMSRSFYSLPFLRTWSTKNITFSDGHAAPRVLSKCCSVLTDNNHVSRFLYPSKALMNVVLASCVQKADWPHEAFPVLADTGNFLSWVTGDGECPTGNCLFYEILPCWVADWPRVREDYQEFTRNLAEAHLRQNRA